VVSSDTEAVSRSTVRQAVTSALQRAADWGIEHLAITPFGLGVGNLDIEESAELLAEAVRRHAQMSKYPSTITVVVETDLELGIFERFMTRTAE
jgi:O-acetyl-ADP-ribose deacetylase (regulator of RNase III)